MGYLLGKIMCSLLNAYNQGLVHTVGPSQELQVSACGNVGKITHSFPVEIQRGVNS